MPEEKEDHLILSPRYGQDGLWWRPKSAGYTADITQAGLFTRSYAERVASNPDPQRSEKAVPLVEKRDELTALRDAAQRMLDAIPNQGT
jgi:hypothetical protein